MDYRSSARQNIENAKELLTSELPNSETYAALELRLALESLIYEKASCYQGELPENKISTWQARKLLQYLLEIDPDADKSSSLAAGVEENYGVEPPNMQFIGTENVLNLGTLKKYYDRIGSYLHSPTLKQLKNDKLHDKGKIRNHCNSLVSEIEKVLSSHVFNMNFKNAVEFECFSCNENVLRRVNDDSDLIKAECINCAATYNLARQKDGSFNIRELRTAIACSNNECSYRMLIWDKDLKIGFQWKCNQCETESEFVLGIKQNISVAG